MTAPPFSLVAWFNTGDTNGGNLISLFKDGNPSHSFILSITAFGDNDVRASTGHQSFGETSAISVAPFWSVDAWHHAAGTWGSATDRNAYLDGGSKGSDTTDRTPGDTVDLLTLAGSEFVAILEGKLAEVGVYNVKLSDGEVQALGRGMSPLAVRPDALVAYWPLHGRIGRIAF